MHRSSDRDRKPAPPPTRDDATINLPPAAAGSDATIQLPAGGDATIQLPPPPSSGDATVNFAPAALSDATIQFTPAPPIANDATIQLSASFDTTSADGGATMVLPPAKGTPDDGTVALGPGEAPRGNASGPAQARNYGSYSSRETGQV